MKRSPQEAELLSKQKPERLGQSVRALLFIITT